MKPTLALSMIVRDAERNLDRCLKSVQGVVDEVVIADTGSIDNTVHLARQHGAQVHSIPWENDFSVARNQALKMVHADWVLILDADERLDPEAAEAIPKLLAQPQGDGFLVTIRNYLNSINERLWDRPALPNDSSYEEARPFPAFVEHENVRLFRRSPEIYFTGRVHETVGTRIQQMGGSLVPADFRIHHFGLATDAETRSRKNALYRDMGWQKVRENPGDAQAHFEIGLVEFDVYRNDQTALECFEKAIRIQPRLSVAWFFAGLASLRLNQAAHAIPLLKRAEALGHAPGLVAEALGDAWYNQGEFQQAGKFYRKSIGIHSTSEVQSKLGLAEVRAGRTTAGWERLRQAILAQPGAADVHDRLIAAAVWLGNLPEAAQAAEHKIACCEPQPEYFLRAASIRTQMDDWQAAANLLSKGREMFPRHERLNTCWKELTQPDVPDPIGNPQGALRSN